MLEYIGRRPVRSYVRTRGVFFCLPHSRFVGYGGDRGAATNARFSSPYSITSDYAGGLYIADRGNRCVSGVDESIDDTEFSSEQGHWQSTRTRLCCSCVRRLLANGTIVAAAGRCGSSGASGNYGPATSGAVNPTPPKKYTSSSNCLKGRLNFSFYILAFPPWPQRCCGRRKAWHQMAGTL